VVVLGENSDCTLYMFLCKNETGLVTAFLESHETAGARVCPTNM
jgi:hypothetical protein